MIVITADFSVKKDYINDFVKLAAECTKHTKKEPGNLSYRVFAKRDDESKFTFIEEWANDTAIEKHGDSAHFRVFMAGIASFLECEPIIKQIVRVAEIR